MTFTAWYYPFFLFVIAILYWKTPHRVRLILLLTSSYFFYAYWDIRFLSLIMASTAMDYILGRAIDGHKTSNRIVISLSLTPFIWLLVCRTLLNESEISDEVLYISLISAVLFISIYKINWKTPTEIRRKYIYILTLAYNIGLLGFFKYFNFFAEQAKILLNLAGFETSDQVLQILLPVGISFYTFQSISYATDIYRKTEKSCSDLLLFATFISFFPQLVAGPIQRTHQLLPQLSKKIDFSKTDLELGIRLILVGYFKKVFVGDNCAIISNYFFSGASEMNLGWIFLGSLAFAFQIYGDFSGYTDIARGSAKVLGIDLSRNFIFPYFAKNPSDFWKRWHISLSTWIRDYIYIPLGGNNGTKIRTITNLFIAMLLAGLWHGAAWNFIIWGAYHATLLTAYRSIPFLSKSEYSSNLSLIFYTTLMFFFTLFGWLIFRSPDISFLVHVITNFFNYQNSQTILKPLLWLMLYITPLLILQYTTRQYQDEAVSINRTWKWKVTDLLVLILLIGSSTSKNQEFIYFQF